MSKLLTPEEFNVAVRYFGITEQGNFVDHSHPSPLPDQNVLSIVDPDAARGRSRRCSASRQEQDARRARASASARIWTTKSSLPGTA